MSATVRINPDTHAKLKALCDQTGDTIPTVLDQAIEHYRRQRFLEDCSQAYGKLRADPKAWQEVLTERAALDGTLSDGLDADVTPKTSTKRTLKSR